jgi:hypothetical protein
MKQAISSAFALLVAVAPAPTRGQVPSAPAPQPGLAAIEGFVIDSVHNAPLTGAMLHVEGTQRGGVTTAEGRYRIDSIPAGRHRIMIVHPVLDTIGIPMVTSQLNFVGGTVTSLDLAIPSAARLVSLVCPAAVLRIRGPGALIGFVHDPDTSLPAVGSKVQLVYEESDPLGLKKTPRVREVNVDSTGNYRICGLPPDMKGKVQVFHAGVSSGEVPAEIENGALALRSLSIAHERSVITEVKTDSGTMKRVQRGTARVTGKVVNKQGQPLANARVTVTGTGSVAITRSNGDFTLDSLPSGTQSLEVRRLGYGFTDMPVELSSATPAHVNVRMNDFVQTLAAMRVEAQVDQDLSRSGYLERKQTGLGRYMDGDQIRKEAMKFSDVMRMAPGLKVVPVGNGRDYVIQSSRDPMGCVNFWVDGFQWRSLEPGDIDQYLRPDELRAIEIYSSTTTPPQFTAPGNSKCETVVVWTVRGPARKK